MRFLYTLLLSALCLGASAQIKYGEKVDADKLPFKPGESLTYTAVYKISLINTDVASVTLKCNSANYEGTDCYYITGQGKMFPAYTWFFDINDMYESYLSKENLRPVYYTVNISEGSYKFKANIKYNWGSKSAYTTYRNLKHADDKHQNLTLSNRSYDAIAQFYNLRAADWSTLATGYTDYFEVVSYDAVRKMQYSYMGRETKNITGLGRCKTHKFKCQILTAGESFKDGSTFYMWFSDDGNKIPLYIETPIRVGSVKVYLSKYSGLKYPFSAK